MLALIGVLVYVIWNRLNDDDYQGDMTAFCSRLEDSQLDEVSYYENLAEVVPRDIRSTVRRLQNASRDLRELEAGDDLEAYFRAAFDPEQETSENELRNYAEEECRLESICDIASPAVFC